MVICKFKGKQSGFWNCAKGLRCLFQNAEIWKMYFLCSSIKWSNEIVLALWWKSSTQSTLQLCKTSVVLRVPLLLTVLTFALLGGPPSLYHSVHVTLATLYWDPFYMFSYPPDRLDSGWGTWWVGGVKFIHWKALKKLQSKYLKQEITKYWGLGDSNSSYL